jgi:hypothetical protein
MLNQPLDIAVKCKGNAQCYLINGEDMLFIEIIITNKHNSAIGYPLEYLKKTGPIIRLTDVHTKKETDVATGTPYPDLQEKFTMIQPGKSLVLEWPIFSYDLKQISGMHVDVTAEITMTDRILVDGKNVLYKDVKMIRIVSKDKP